MAKQNRVLGGLAAAFMGGAIVALGPGAVILLPQDYATAQLLTDLPENSPEDSEADRLFQQGLQQYRRSEFREALQSWEAALQGYRTSHNRQGEARSLGNLGLAYSALGQYERALELHQHSLAIARELGDRQGEAKSLGNLGGVYFSLGQYPKAIELHEQSLALKREMGDRQGEAQSLGNLGLAYKSLGQFQRAIDLHQQSLAIKREMGDQRGEAISLSHLGLVYGTLGQYERALELHQHSLAIQREIGHRQGEANSLGNLGLTYQLLGQYERAIELHQQYGAIAREIGDRPGEANSLGNLGIAYQALGQYERAINVHQRALAIYRDIGNRKGEAACLGNLGNAYQLLGQYEPARDFHQHSLAISRDIGDRRGEAKSLGNLGNVYDRLGQPERALDFSQQYGAIAREIGDRAGEAKSLANQGYLYFKTQRLDESATSLRASLVIFEEIQRDVGKNDRDRVSFLEIQQEVYLLLQRTLIAHNQIPEALEVADRSRARSLLAFLAEANSQTKPTLSAAEMQAVAHQQNATIVLYSEVFTDLYLWVVPPTGQIAFRRVPWPQNRSDLAQTAAGLRDSAITTRLLASRGEDSEAVAQGVGGNAASFAQGLWHDLDEGLRSGSAATTSATTTFSPTSLRQGYDLLIQPIADLLPPSPAAKVILVPHRELALVPFAALRDEQGKFLIDRYTLAIAPSVSVLAETGRTPPNTTGRPLIVGNPSPMPDHLTPLPGAAAEAKAIAQTLQTPALIGPQATETALKAHIDQASLLHFATHGTIAQSAAGELESWLALAPDGSEDGKLTIAEIFSRHLSARLAVLSACETGAGDVTGEGVVGLARAFLKAGVPTVVASLWKVPDEPTSLMMQRFYAERSTGKDAATALRSAMLSVREQYPGPQNWAAFVAIGDTN